MKDEIAGEVYRQGAKVAKFSREEKSGTLIGADLR